MPTYSLINNGESGLSVRTTLNDLLTDINNGVYIGPTGATGFSGTSGTSGSSGTSAVDGTSGTSGQDGAQGTSGASGTSGVDGTSGTSGQDGAQGTSGASGTSGVDGTSGVNGTSGTSGVDGTSNIPGPTGSNGATGSSPFPSEFFETYLSPVGTTASILDDDNAGWNSNNILTGVTGSLAGQRHYNNFWVYEAVQDNTWLKYAVRGQTGPTGSAGTSGVNGTSGSSGTSGVSITGETGATGPSPFPADFFETYISSTSSAALELTSPTASWNNNLIGPTGFSDVYAGQRHYDIGTGYIYDAVEDNIWLRSIIAATGFSGTFSTGDGTVATVTNGLISGIV